MVMGGDLRSRGGELESQHWILDGHFFTLYCCKYCNVCLLKAENTKKDTGNGSFLRNFEVAE